MDFHSQFEEARDFLILHRTQYDKACSEFKWPQVKHFNWALDYFDPMAENNTNIALWIVQEDGSELKRTFAEISARSNQAANFFRSLGLKRGDPVFLMLGNDPAFWEIMLGLMKLGAVVVPSNPLLSQQELQEHFAREKVSMLVTSVRYAHRFHVSGDIKAVLTDGGLDGWESYSAADQQSHVFETDESTHEDDPFLHYYTSNQSIRPRLVEYTYGSFPVGHLSTLYWMGLNPGDVHLALNSSGWPMHEWNSLFVPWTAEATVFVLMQERFDAKQVLEALNTYPITSFCTTPTVWKRLLQEGIEEYQPRLREALSTGGTLRADVISHFQKNWGLFIRDGYSHETETSVIIGIPPEDFESYGALGKAMPGFDVSLLDQNKFSSDRGEIVVNLKKSGSFGLMNGINKFEEVYRTGDLAFKDSNGNFNIFEKSTELFMSSDFRISPFELEHILREFPLVREAVVIPSADESRENVPKAIVSLVRGTEPSKELALTIMNYTSSKVSPHKRVRRLEFAEIPVSEEGEIYRTRLIMREKEKRINEIKSEYEFWEEDAKVSFSSTWSQELP